MPYGFPSPVYRFINSSFKSCIKGFLYESKVGDWNVAEPGCSQNPCNCLLVVGTAALARASLLSGSHFLCPLENSKLKCLTEGWEICPFFLGTLHLVQLKSSKSKLYSGQMCPLFYWQSEYHLHIGAKLPHFVKGASNPLPRLSQIHGRGVLSNPWASTGQQYWCLTLVYRSSHSKASNSWDSEFQSGPGLGTTGWISSTVK